MIWLRVKRRRWRKRNVLIKGNWAKKPKSHLTSYNSVHPNSVEVVRSDFHVRTENWTELDTKWICVHGQPAEQKNGLVVEFGSDKVEQLKLGWCATLRLQ